MGKRETWLKVEKGGLDLGGSKRRNDLGAEKSWGTPKKDTCKSMVLINDSMLCEPAQLLNSKKHLLCGGLFLWISRILAMASYQHGTFSPKKRLMHSCQALSKWKVLFQSICKSMFVGGRAAFCCPACNCGINQPAISPYHEQLSERQSLQLANPTGLIVFEEALCMYHKFKPSDKATALSVKSNCPWSDNFGGKLGSSACGWTKSISHHFETTVNHYLFVFTWKSQFQGFSGAGFRPSTVLRDTLGRG